MEKGQPAGNGEGGEGDDTAAGEKEKKKKKKQFILNDRFVTLNRCM